MGQLLRKVIALFRWNRDEGELDRELTAHLALIEESYQRRGLSAEEARLAARRAMGSTSLTKDRHRDARSFMWLEDLRRDLRQAVRGLQRSPGYTLLAVLALSLGIGVNTTFFTIVNAICLRGLPIDSPERVMFVSLRDAQGRSGNLSIAEFEDLRARITAFGQVGGYTNTVAAVGDTRQPPARVLGAYISASGIELLGDRPILGRTFHPDEDRPGAPAVVIIGWELWRSRYASDPGIVGQSITVNGVPSTVIGVMPRGFMFPANADIWRPMASYPAAVRQSPSDRRLAIYARLAAGATLEQARAELATIDAAWARDAQAPTAGRLQAVPINEQLNPSVWQRTWIAFITAGALVLLVSCANVANLLLMRGAGRARELAVRTSMGATRGRVVRQLLVESGTLVVAAGMVGILLAWASLRLLEGLVPPETLPYWMAFTIDARVLAVTLGVCAGCVFVCGLPSALHVSKIDLLGSLTDGGATMAARPARRWIAALLAAEFAVTLVLVSFAVMSVRADVQTRRLEFQIDPASMLTMWATLPADPYATPNSRLAFYDQLAEAAGRSEAIRSFALASALPYGGGTQQPVTIAGRAIDSAPPLVSTVAISERYFDVLGVPLVSGRAFTPLDGRPGSQAAIVNQRFVRLFFSDEDPIGARIRLGGPESPWLQIIGVATTVRQQAIGAEPDPVVFLPHRALLPPVAVILVRIRGPEADAIALLRGEVARLDPNLPLFRVMSFEQAVRNAVWNGRLSNVIVRSIAAVALVLALVGLYAVTGHTVERWRRELGLRVALGARSGQIGWLVIRRVLLLLGLGLGVGIVAAQAFDQVFNDPGSRPVGSVGMMDPAAMSLTVLAIAVVALVACLVPIRQATRVDPLVALRTE
jgi:putative ABC transport system permease protein